MKLITPACFGVLMLSVLAAPIALGDRYSDYWKPENMAARQCTSVHLRYAPTMKDIRACYTEIVVEKSAPGTYFASNNFSNGYIGVQEAVRGGKVVRVAIFSVWDAQDTGDNPNAASEADRAQLIQKGAHVTTRRFGGEGTGGNSMRIFDWKEGEVIRTLVVEKPDGKSFRQISGYIFDAKTKTWELLSCWRVQALTTGLGAGSGFVEDFKRDVDSKLHERRATFGPNYALVGDRWIQSDQFKFTKDGNPNMEINCSLNKQRGFYSLATGGSAKMDPNFPVFTDKKLSPLPKSEGPGKPIMDIVNMPIMEKLDYQQDAKPL